MYDRAQQASVTVCTVCSSEQPTTNESFETDLNIGREQKTRQQRQRRLHNLEIRGGLASAEVGKSPGHITNGRDATLLAKRRADLQQGRESTKMQNKISALNGITGHVAQRPCGLFANILIGRHEKTNEDRNRASVNHKTSVLRRS